MATNNAVNTSLSGQTGTGNFVGATSPTLVTALLGTPTSGTLTNCTGYVVGNISGLGAGVATALAVNVGSAGAFVTFNGALGTPSSGTLTSCTGLPAAGISGTSNGGIFYSTATTGAILAGTATANQVILSGSSAAPAWSTATYPATTTINQLLYSSAANVIAGLATANSGVLVTSSGGVPSISSTLPSGMAATNLTLTTPALGTPSSGDLSSCGAQNSFTLTTTGTTSGTGTAYYVKIGKQCFISYEGTGSFTSNATSFTMTGLPFTAGTTANGNQFIPVTRVINASADLFGVGWAAIADGGTTITFFLSGSATGWTAANGKLVNFRGFYWTT